MKPLPAVLALLSLGAAACAVAGMQVAARRQKPAAVSTGPTLEADRSALIAATASLLKKNAQLEALNNVFSEITESLEIRYVIASTLREAIKLMGADMAVVRTVQDDELVAIGAMASSGQEIQNISSVGVSDGPTGRAFRSRKTVRIDENGERSMAPANVPDGRPDSPATQTGRAPLESGLIVPLILGARMVGTISCWSRSKFAFDDDDQHILEMLASQVATAIVAADAMEHSQRRAVTDPLTELPNRLQFNDDLRGSLAELAASGRCALVAMADIDHFKRFNDEYSHHTGDVALQKVASVLRATVRDGDHLYRYGGEEFVFIFCDAAADQADVLAERVRAAVEATPFEDENGTSIGPITISIGVAQLPLHGNDIAALIELADIAMYKAKSTGRNRVVLWEESMAMEQAA